MLPADNDTTGGLSSIVGGTTLPENKPANITSNDTSNSTPSISLRHFPEGDFHGVQHSQDIELIPREEIKEKRSKPKDDKVDKAKADIGLNEFTPLKLGRMMESKNLEMLEAFGGVKGILRGLGTDARRGLTYSPGAFEERRRVYGQNVLPSRKSKSIWRLMWIALNQKVLALLSVAAIVAFALGIFQDFGAPRETYTCGQGQTCEMPPVDWVKGVAIMIAVAVVVVFSSFNDWQKERQFKELNEKKEDRTIKVIRDGNEAVVNVKDLVVGDVAIIDPGEVIPCDGLFLSGYNVRCDESSITGESDAIKKGPYEACLSVKGRDQFRAHTDCFVISGSKVLEGVGSYVIVAVGEMSCNGRIMMALRQDTEDTPLQEKLKIFANWIVVIASISALLLFTILLIRFLVQVGRGQPSRTAKENGLTFVDILVYSVSLFVVAIPEGLPLAVTLSLALATKRMTSEKLLVRVLAGCETMANASIICTDKTGTLTQNSMTVVAGVIGVRAKFAQGFFTTLALENVTNERATEAVAEQDGCAQYEVDNLLLDRSELKTKLSPALKCCLNAAICVNSTAFEDLDRESGERVFVGSKTETALLQFAKDLDFPDYQKTRENAKVVHMIPFSSQRKAMGTVVQLHDGRWRLYVKGASEILTKRCVRYVIVIPTEEDVEGRDDEFIETNEMNADARENISWTITAFANKALRTIALCYRDFDSWPPSCAGVASADEVPYEALAADMTLIGITGIEDPLREGVTDAVAQCTKAGVQVKMCTGDNALTARSIASQSGILTRDGTVMEGPVFRELDNRELLEVVPHLQVLARASPEDKRILVEKLKELGEIVAVTGDGTNDGPALKSAHIGFSMGLTGTEVAKEASDIIIMDDNFTNIVKAIMWGRCVNDALRKFLQFQIGANVTAVLVTFVSAVAKTQESAALTAVQLLWVNLIVNSFAALALATDPATPALLDRKPDRLNAPLFTVDMYKQIFGQSLYQTTVILVFFFAGNHIFGFSPDPNNEAVQIENDAKLSTLVFNAFVFAQIFNSINCRRIGNHKNIFDGIHRNWYFISIVLLEIGLHVVIVFVGGRAFSVTRISGMFWGISLALGFMSIPIGFLLRCIPNQPIERFFYKIHLMHDASILPTERPDTVTKDIGKQSSALTNAFDRIRKWPSHARNSVVFSRSSTLVGTAVTSPVGHEMVVKPGVRTSLGSPSSPQERCKSVQFEEKPGLHPTNSRQFDC